MAWIMGIRILGAPRAAIISTLEPVVGVALAALLLSEVPTPLQVVGGAFIVDRRDRRPAPARGRTRRARGGAGWLYPALVISRRRLAPACPGRARDRRLHRRASPVSHHPRPAVKRARTARPTPEPSPTPEPTPTPEPLIPDNALLPNLVMEPLAEWSVEYDDAGRAPAPRHDRLQQLRGRPVRGTGRPHLARRSGDHARPGHLHRVRRHAPGADSRRRPLCR